MEIKRIRAQPPSGKGPADWFMVQPYRPAFSSTRPARRGASVTFEGRDARNRLATHPLGQRLIVTAGCGWAQAGKRCDRGTPFPEMWFGSRPGRKKIGTERRTDHGPWLNCNSGGARRAKVVVFFWMEHVPATTVQYGGSRGLIAQIKILSWLRREFKSSFVSRC